MEFAGGNRGKRGDTARAGARRKNQHEYREAPFGEIGEARLRSGGEDHRIGPRGLTDMGMITVHFTSANGTKRSVQTEVGASLMRAATESGVPGILAECGGSGTCATCHVYVEEDWLESLPAPTDDELDMIDFAWGRKDNSRLACQLVLDTTMDGLSVNVPARQA